MKYRKFIALSLLLLATGCCSDRYCYFDPDCPEEECYDPYYKYYPFAIRYQDSDVYEPYDDEPTWPGREDDDLVDELFR